jgi:hypothetical protein
MPPVCSIAMTLLDATPAIDSNLLQSKAKEEIHDDEFDFFKG